MWQGQARGMAHGLCELLWIMSVLKKLGIEYERSISLHCDSKVAIKIAYNLVQHDLTMKLIVTSSKKIWMRKIHFSFIKSEDQLVNVLTKAIYGIVFHSVINNLGMIDIYAPTKLRGSVDWWVVHLYWPVLRYIGTRMTRELKQRCVLVFN